jgi:hypothetical protein
LYETINQNKIRTTNIQMHNYVVVVVIVVLVIGIGVIIYGKYQGNIEPFEDVSGCQLVGSYKVYKCGEEVRVVNLDATSEEQPPTMSQTMFQTEICPTEDYLKKHPEVHCRHIMTGNTKLPVNGKCPSGTTYQRNRGCVAPFTECQGGYELINGQCFEKCLPPYQTTTKEVDVNNNGKTEKRSITVCLRT